MIVRIILLGTFFCCSIVVGAMAQKGKPVTGNTKLPFISGHQIRSLLSGSKVYHESPRSGKPLVMTFNKDGSALTKVSDGRRDTGRWWVKGNVFCMQFSKVVDARRLCMKFVQRGEYLVRYKSDDKKLRGIDWKILKSG